MINLWRRMTSLPRTRWDHTLCGLLLRADLRAFARVANCSRRPPLQASAQFCESGGICARILSRGLACLRARCSTWIFAWTDVRLAFQMLSWSVHSVDEMPAVRASLSLIERFLLETARFVSLPSGWFCMCFAWMSAYPHAPYEGHCFAVVCF